MHMIIFQDYGESGGKLQDDVITTKHLVSNRMQVDTIVQTKRSS